MAKTIYQANPNNLQYIGVDDVSLMSGSVSITGGLLNVATYVWDTTNLVWVKATQASGGGGGGSVTVTNFPAVQPVQETTNPLRGTSSYFAGTSGTVAIPAGARVVSIAAHATSASSVTIFGGASIPIPAGNGFSDGYSGFVGAGNIVFTGTDSYYVVVNQ